jgi:hypothetical protein
MKQKNIFSMILLVLILTITVASHSQDIPGENASKPFECRVNVGGDRWIDAQGKEWLPDKIYREGYGYLGLSATFTSNEAISGTNNPHIYQSERYKLYGYRVDAPNGHYEIILHFAEIYHDRAGARLMDIKIEGMPVLSSLDIYNRVGKNVALKLAFNTKDLGIPVTDKRIDIAIENRLDDTKLSAIEVIQLSEQPSLLKIEPPELNFGSSINTLPISITNLGNSNSEWKIKTSDLPKWIFVSEATTGMIAPEAKASTKISVNRTGMSSGIHNDNITITANDFEEKIPVSIIVAGAAKLSLQTATLDFKDNLRHLTCIITNSGGTILNWSIDTNKLPSWIERIYPDRGILNIADTAFINVSVSRKKLTAGSHIGTLPVRTENDVQNVSLKISLPQANSRHLFVDANASGAKNGKSWEDAFTQIKEAIASVGRSGLNETVETWVAEGIYYENNLRVPPGVQLFGGFEGNEAVRSERQDCWSHPTIVDGQKQGRCFECEHRTAIDGFVIQNGRDWTSGDGKGAAILAYDNDVQIRNNLVQNNVDSWAGAIFIEGFERTKNAAGFSPLIENNVLIKNLSNFCAAAIEVRGSAAIVRQNTIVNNHGYGLEIQAVVGPFPKIIYGDFYNNIIANNFRIEHDDVWGEARKVTNYSYVGHRWSLNGEFGTYNYGKENIFGDATGKKPGFIDDENADYRLRSDSPCIDAGNPKSRTDPDGSRPDLGAFPFHHNQPELIISSPKLKFDPGVTEQKMTISAYGGKSISWRVAPHSPGGAIISAKPNSGILQNGEKTKVTITVDRANLADGSYNGYIAFMSPAQSIETKMSILVNSASPEIKLSRSELEIEATLNGATPESRQVQIRNSGVGNFTWTAQKKFNAEWLRLTPTSGKNGDNLTIEFDITNLQFGDYHEQIRIDAPGSINKIAELPVTLKMRPGKFVYEVEAEKSISFPNVGWNITENDGAKCIQSLKNNLEMPDKNTRIDYEFEVPEGVENVYVFAELDVNQSRSNDSFWVQMNGFDLCPWDYIYSPRDGWFRGWIYHKLRDEQHTFVVIPGKNTLGLFSREQGGFINWFVITNDPDINIDTYQFGAQKRDGTR